jgi:DNA-binding PucR family transcriptional regulator
VRSVTAFFERDREFVARFVKQELGSVEALGRRGDVLLETLQVYLRHGQRPTNAARVCRCDPDTIRNRLREIEVLLGYRVEDRSVELGLALLLRKMLHAAVGDERLPDLAAHSAAL